MQFYQSDLPPGSHPYLYRTARKASIEFLTGALLALGEETIQPPLLVSEDVLKQLMALKQRTWKDLETQEEMNALAEEMLSLMLWTPEQRRVVLDTLTRLSLAQTYARSGSPLTLATRMKYTCTLEEVVWMLTQDGHNGVIFDLSSLYTIFYLAGASYVRHEGLPLMNTWYVKDVARVMLSIFHYPELLHYPERGLEPSTLSMIYSAPPGKPRLPITYQSMTLYVPSADRDPLTHCTNIELGAFCPNLALEGKNTCRWHTALTTEDLVKNNPQRNLNN